MSAHLVVAVVSAGADRGLPSTHAAEIYRTRATLIRRSAFATTDALRQRLGLDAAKLILTFQSRFGYDEWLKPYTDKTIEQLARDGVRRIAVVMPGFSADCLGNAGKRSRTKTQRFSNTTGGEQFAAIPCLNDSDAGMDVIRQLVLRELQGWI